MEGLNLTPKEFSLFKELIYRTTGIHLSEQKLSLVKSRLNKRVNQLELSSFHDYYIYVERHPQELSELINAMTTNVTSFFREPNQWEYLKSYFAKSDINHFHKRIRIWSSASSTGQEPYSIAIALLEFLPNAASWDIKILATDMDTKVLEKAQKGLYTESDIGNLSKNYLQKYFTKVYENNKLFYQVKQQLKEMIIFRSFNLVRGDYTIFSNTFDMIFCRNVMIYFDGPTRETLLKNFHRILKDDGHLFVGHSESITTLASYYSIIIPSIYKRKKT